MWGSWKGGEARCLAVVLAGEGRDGVHRLYRPWSRTSKTLEIPQTKSCHNGRRRSVQSPAPHVISASISSTSLEQSVQRRRFTAITSVQKVPKSSVRTILNVRIVDNVCIVLNFWKQASVQRMLSTRKMGQPVHPYANPRNKMYL
uniref:Uncharacterized protein n=1 Tax=Triticum urartu TaxID=4572 RepID=A0A8R7U7P5_TRIUA